MPCSATQLCFPSSSHWALGYISGKSLGEGAASTVSHVWTLFSGGPVPQMSWAEEGRGPRLPSWVAKAPLGSVGWVRAQNWDTDREPGTTVTLVTPSHQIRRQRLASEVAGRQGQEKPGLFQALGDWAPFLGPPGLGWP